MDIHRRKACIAILIAILSKRRVKRKRWVKDWLLKRDFYTHINLLTVIRDSKDDKDFANYFRMKDACFDKLLVLVTPYLKKQDTCMRKAITPEEKLAVTLRYLATGRNIEDIKFSAVMSPAAIIEAIMDTCRALIYVLQDYMKVSVILNNSLS